MIIEDTTVPDSGFPGSVLGTGILHPKIRNKFHVLFRGVLNEDYAKVVSVDEAHALIRGLSMQTLSVILPAQVFRQVQYSPYAYPAPVGFKSINHASKLTITLEDDVTHVVERALELLQNMHDIEVLVMTLDADEGVLDAHLFTRVYLDAIWNGPLDYASSDTVTRILTLDAKHMFQSVPRQDLAANAFINQFRGK